MSQKLTKKVATSKNAAMILGQHGVHGIHAPNVGTFHLNDNTRDENSPKFPLVHKRVNRFDTNIKREIVKVHYITICHGIILMPGNPGEIYFTRFMEQKTMLPRKLNANLMVLF